MKERNKRILSLLLAMTVAVTSVPVNVLAEDVIVEMGNEAASVADGALTGVGDGTFAADDITVEEITAESGADGNAVLNVQEAAGQNETAAESVTDGNAILHIQDETAAEPQTGEVTEIHPQETAEVSENENVPAAEEVEVSGFEAEETIELLSVDEEELAEEAASGETTPDTQQAETLSSLIFGTAAAYNQAEVLNLAPAFAPEVTEYNLDVYTSQAYEDLYVWAEANFKKTEEPEAENEAEGGTTGNTENGAAGRITGNAENEIHGGGI